MLCNSNARLSMSRYGPPEIVFVENEWCDGPRAGIANVGGTPHRFKSLFDEKEDEYLSTFVVWPIGKPELDQEIEQWQIFVEWNTLFEAGVTSTESHPAHGGLNARWDELEVLLRLHRSEVPASAKRANAEFHRIDGESRYALSGPDYRLSWSIQ
jgi:hypothetical protein